MTTENVILSLTGNLMNCISKMLHYLKKVFDKLRPKTENVILSLTGDLMIRNHNKQIPNRVGNDGIFQKENTIIMKRVFDKLRLTVENVTFN